MRKSPPLSVLENAREALRRLASKNLPPTPENYRMAFHEVLGQPDAPTFPADEFKALQAALPRKSTQQIHLARQLETAISEKSWDSFKDALIEFLANQGSTETPWPGLMRELLRQLDVPHAEVTAFQKKKALEHILATTSKADLLLTRIQSLVGSWTRNTEKNSQELASLILSAPPATNLGETAALPPEAEKMLSTDTQWQDGIPDLQSLIAQVLDNILAIVLRNNPELIREANEISVSVKAAQNTESLVGLSGRLKKLCYRTHFIAEDEAEVNVALLHLIQLIMDNISELVVEDQWVTGQIGMMRDLLLQPLDLRRLDEVERRLKDVIVKQGLLKKELTEANDRLKLMLAAFVDHLTNFSETTSVYHGKIEACAEKMSRANGVSELTEVLNEVMYETRMVQVDTARSRDELSLMQKRVQEAEQEVARLQSELSTTSKMIRHDPLTGALNRKGLDEALQKEVNRYQRQGGDLSIALLDIDNFKQINDDRGHAVGDAALVHLATVIQETVRSQDTLARYGGEEFVVLLPNTGTEAAVSIMTRVQRELTRKFFMANNDKVLITFSCGLVNVAQAEDPHEALQRADAAMYLAKRSGKNRVISA